MPPCIDVYVWVPRSRAAVVYDFVTAYVDTDHPGDDRLWAWIRTCVDGSGSDADAEVVADLRRERDDPTPAVYVNARQPYVKAILAQTREGAIIVGLSVDDELQTADGAAESERLLDELMAHTEAREGLAAVEHPPPRDRHEWGVDVTTVARRGSNAPS